MRGRSATARKGDVRSTRDLILDAAERHFAERGFAGVSVREIAAEAGLKNQASLYHHFRNKRALYEAVLARGLEPILTLVAQSDVALAPSSLSRFNDQFIDGVLAYLADHPHLPRLIQRAGLDDSRYLKSSVSKLLRPLYTAGVHVLAGTSREWPEAEIPHLAAGLYHLIFGYFANATLLESVLDEDPRSPQAIARQREFVKKAVARLLGT